MEEVVVGVLSVSRRTFIVKMAHRAMKGERKRKVHLCVKIVLQVLVAGCRWTSCPCTCKSGPCLYPCCYGSSPC